MLLVLDNFEHLLLGVELLAEILEQAPSVVMLVTSRERLHLQGEWVFNVAGLQYPLDGQTDDHPNYSAVQLFVQTAKRACASFTLTAAEQPYVTRICRFVEGLPLGIELAAAWVHVLSCQEIAQQIETSMLALVTSLRGLPERHHSLRAVLDRSWQLLAEDEQHVLRQLSVFQGGFQREAAEQVTGASLPILVALVDKSLLRTHYDSGTSPRYDLHELVRQYAHEQLLKTGATEQTQDCHLQFFLRLAEEAELKLQGAEQAVWLEHLEREHDNLRAALEWSLKSRKMEAGLRLVGALWRFWVRRCYFDEGRQWVEQMLSLSNVGFPMVDAGMASADQRRSQRLKSHIAMRAKAFHGSGVLARMQGDYTRASAVHEESLTLRRKQGDQRGIAASLNSLGLVLHAQGKYMQAQTYFEESLALQREFGDKRGIAIALNNRGLAVHRQGDEPQAQTCFEESLVLFRDVGDKDNIADTLHNLGYVLHAQGDDAQAHIYFKESLALFQEVGDKEGIAMCLEASGAIAMAQGQPPRAVLLWGAAEALRTTIGAPLSLATRADYEHRRAAACAHLGEATFTTAWVEGQAMSLEQAIAHAFSVVMNIVR